jgi:hypothetical protein
MPHVKGMFHHPTITIPIYISYISIMLALGYPAKGQLPEEDDAGRARAGAIGQSARATKVKGTGKSKKTKQKKAAAGANTAKNRAVAVQAAQQDVATAAALAEAAAAGAAAMAAVQAAEAAAAGMSMEQYAAAAAVNAVKDEAGWEVFRECMYGECNAADNKPYARCYVEFTNESALGQCAAYADPARTEDYKKYWNNVFLAEDMRGACAKKGGKYDPVIRECTVTITLRQQGRYAKDAKGLKIAAGVGCDNTYSKEEKVGAGSIECGGPTWGLPQCYHADQDAIDDKKAAIKTGVLTSVIGVAGGVAAGVVAGLANKSCKTGQSLSGANDCYESIKDGNGVGEKLGQKSFNVGSALAVGLTPAVAAVGTGVTTALVAKGQEVKGGLEADVTCYINNALAASKGEMIDLRW